MVYPSHIADVEYGRSPAYNLKTPIILLRDDAKTSSIQEGQLPPIAVKRDRPTMRRSSTYSDKPIESSQEEFIDFVDHLLGSLGKAPLSATEPFLNPNALRSPSPTPTRERYRRLSCREAIDMAVQHGIGKSAGASKSKLGIFEIGKGGIRVATLILPRTTFKLGDTIEGVLDLADEAIKCYQVCLYLIANEIKSILESAEDIDPGVSVRSQSSIYRATKRVHGTKSEWTTFARRVQFAFAIPTGAAPTFETSSGNTFTTANPVRHHWSLRLEFLTSLTPEPNPDDPQPSTQDLLILSEKGDRANTYIATDTLYCETFDCHVPVVVLPTNQEIPEDRVGLAGFVV
jgi:hypothetical protein